MSEDCQGTGQRGVALSKYGGGGGGGGFGGRGGNVWWNSMSGSLGCRGG